MNKTLNQTKIFSLLLLVSVIFSCSKTEDVVEKDVRIVEDFNFNWNFKLGDFPEAIKPNFQLTDWRTLNLPHDWSIEGEFSEEHPTKPEGGALPAGIGWYRKTFSLPVDWNGKSVSVEFDGVYRNSEVWINGHYLGKRPFGYISFAYNLTDYLNFGTKENVIAVKVDNSLQPNSRWYTGSGIYRNVRLVATENLYVDHWGTYITTPKVIKDKATVAFETTIKNDSTAKRVFKLVNTILDSDNLEVVVSEKIDTIQAHTSYVTRQQMEVVNPVLWSVENPYLYTVKTKIYEGENLVDNYETPLGIRYFSFNAKKGFSLNGVSTKIHGVCLHHDNGALGAVANKHAIKRKLQIMKDMGVNAIRVAHNPSSLELLQLCDEMGLIVQVEAFDVWKKRKVKNDYNLEWDEWHKRDLQDLIRRDRNNPSVMMWSIGNEIREQFDSTGIAMTKNLVKIVKSLDQTRPVTCALTENIPEKNFIYQSGALDLLGFNYKHEDYGTFPENFKGQKIIASESVSALETRGHYDATSPEIKFWPPAHNESFDGNDDYTVSAYDNVAAYWGTTHEENWKTVKKLDYIAGTFIWTGFDYIGEPIPYPYPARSSYFGIVDLAGLPKDVYYMYQSEWSYKNVLHVLPHWNWNAGQEVDVWAYYNNADEVELFVNGTSQGVKSKQDEELHVSWKVNYEPGTIKVVSRKAGQVVLEKEVHTAGAASQIALEADKAEIKNDNYDLVYVTVNVNDDQGNLAPRANNLIQFEVTGGGKIVGVDNGYQASLESFKAKQRKAYNGKCVVIIQSNGKTENIQMKATSDGLKEATIQIDVE
ncbi:glycoside hydrolase family 2 TIM barrel-domain containing protein [Aestuariibaculum sp. YM273]|uniref:sugar-binding domain-containing protein n=1 Tax=Aestuariibaculum sp. YM273 TaxID=3070659 RepID=UPI0027DBD212|nr:sugar-binding domain-containing protein [Aestuariibaculum sp. YM273]WMI66206.1 glycoside hydrolase family 2 TIM barrel-domain containing protein [Aestuariibaculum sp. YM273]